MDSQYLPLMEIKELHISQLPSLIFKFSQTTLINMSQLLAWSLNNFINMLFLKAYNDSKQMAAFGIALTWINSTNFTIMVSLNNGLLLQASHAFGAKNYKMMSDQLQKAAAINLLVFISFCFQVIFMKELLMFLGVEGSTAEVAASYIYCVLPAYLFLIYSDIATKWLMAQGIFHIQSQIQLLMTLMQPIFNYIFVFRFDLQIRGLAISRNCMEFLIMIGLYYQIKRNNICPLGWRKFNLKESLRDWGSFLRVAIPAGSITFLEWVFFEIQMILIAKLKDDNAIAAQASFGSISLMFYMNPLGLSNTTSSYLGQLMGAGAKKEAINFSKVASITSILFFLIWVILGLCTQNFFVNSLTTDDVMKRYFDNIYTYYLFVYYIFDCGQCVMGAILRSINKQDFAMWVYLFAFYGFGLPASWYFTFTAEVGLMGVWFGITLGGVIVNVAFLKNILNTDWDKQIIVVQEKVKMEQHEIELLKLSITDQ